MTVRLPIALLCYVSVTLLHLLFALPCRAENPVDVLPADEREPGILSPAEFFEFAIGSRHLRHDQVTQYFRYLADASDRVSLLPYGQTHGGRPLLVAAISSPQNIESLDAVQRARRRLTNGTAHRNLEDELLVMYMGYSVHGDESSAVNAAPLVAYHLASSLSANTTDWLEQGLFLIDPALNPDGVDRFANWANENRGKFPSPAAIDREHVQPWPGGRTNYYWFDLNRDWLPGVHPESRGRIKLFHTWKPNVVLDFHEMSNSSSFFFQPGIPARNNPLSPEENLLLTREFAKEHAKAMDAADELFFTEERFDDFYIGKGSTYPDLHGSIGILFEQGSTRGLKIKNERVERHFRDTIANQVRTSLSSLRVANARRQELLEFQTGFYSEAIAAAQKASLQGYLLEGTPSRIDAAAALLRSHAIRVYQPSNSIQQRGRQIAASNVLVIPLVQPETTFVRSLMEPLQEFKENIFYDVSTWHLPSAFDLDMHRLESTVPADWLETPWKPKGSRVNDSAGDHSTLDVDFNELAGFAFEPTELNAPRLAAALQRAGATLRVSTQELTVSQAHEQKELKRGSFFVLRQPNQRNWGRLEKLVQTTQASGDVEILPMHSSMTSSGPDLGSDTMLQLPKCNPLLVVGDGTSAYAAGAIWHYLDIRMRQASTRVDARRLSGTELEQFSCVILPPGAYDDWDETEITQLKEYARGGGTVIAIASAIRWAERSGLISKPKEESSDPEPEHPSVARKFGTARDDRALESIAGAFLEVSVDATHPLAYGLPDDALPVFRNHTLRFAPPEIPYSLAAEYNGVIAGYVSQRNRKRLKGSAAAWVENSGRGRMIMLADNPVFRGYVRSSERLLSNAILLGPSIQIPAPPTQAASADAHGHSH